MNIRIIYEDSDLLVIDKPAGITVNKSDTTVNQETVQEWAESELRDERGEMRVDEESDFYKRGGVVHRLDKETSGILLIAKNVHAFEELQRQFKEREVKKTYLSLAHGKIVPAAGEINVPVGRLPWNRKQFGIITGGRESVTKYKTISNYKSPISNEIFTLVELYPQSGRTHQIRVHLKYIGHPVFSDFLYAGRKTARSDRKILPRVFLHAAKISFVHPKTGESVAFESVLPTELSEQLKEMTAV